MDMAEIKTGAHLFFQGDYDVECGTVIGFAHDGDVILDVMGIETCMDPCCLYDDPADARD